jgi:hypothetical protein
MTELDISNNNMNGQIPKDICLIFPNLEILRMAKNGFTGFIQQSIFYSKTRTTNNNNGSSAVKQQFEWAITDLGVQFFWPDFSLPKP